MKLATRIAGFLFIAFIVSGLVGASLFLYHSRNLPDPSQIGSRQIVQSTKIYDRTGDVLLYEIHGEEKRTVVPYDEIPDIVKQAAIVVEDQNFYEHPAFDWKGIIRAAVTDITTGEATQGGSTITQQLVKNAFLTPEKTISRKLKELSLAIRMEKQFSKDEILGLYLNQIPYGQNAYGIEAASQTYFEKSVSELTAAEAALLAALPQRPSYYNPYGDHYNELKARQELILSKLHEGNFINEDEYIAAINKKLEFAPPSTSIKAPHFVIHVRDYLNQRYGEEFVEKAGLRVITTLNWDYQEIAEEAIKNGVERNKELYDGNNAALVAQDPKTGQVLALVGSVDYFDVENEGNFNVATQGLRQPGSSFKPFAYLAAFEKGYPDQTIVFDLPTEFDTTGDPEKSYQPENYDHIFRGPISLRNALAQSVNIPAVKTLYLAGMQDTIDTAQALGITTLGDRNRYGLSLVLGGGEVKLIDMVNAYSTLAQEGIHHEQSIVLRIEDANGRVLEEYRDSSEKVYDTEPVRLLNDVLSDELARQPLFGRSNSLKIPGHEIAAKTGTTNDFRDAWTIGYTPGLVVGVWAGNNDNSPMNKGGISILAATPIWQEFTEQILPEMEPELFPKPTFQQTSKPMLNGEYMTNYSLGDITFPHIHSILHYVHRNDPLGEEPENPSENIQFKNWEDPVLAWIESTFPDADRFNQPLPDEIRYIKDGTYEPSIALSHPIKGDFISLPLTVKANAQAPLGIRRITLYINGKKVHELSFDSQQQNGDNEALVLPSSHTYNTVVQNASLDLQNSIKIEVEDKYKNTASDSIIVFR